MYKEKISAWVDAHKDEMLEDICELCRVNSEKMPAEEDMPFGPGTAECLDMALDMAEGYGFGAEGDWKTAALYRTTWFMSQGMPNGCSFLEDYTLNFDGEKSAILQAHMLEVCPLIAEQKPKLEIHRLSIGIDSETARLVFTSKQGKGVAATIVDLGNRFRLIVNKVECIKSKPLPKLPVASALWIPMPNLEVGAAAWILAGGTHHTSFSYDLTVEDWGDFAEMAGIEMIVIDENTTIKEFKKELRMNEVYYMLNKALC